MIQYYSVINRNIPQMSSVHETKTSQYNYLEKLEYVTKGHIAMYAVLF